MTAEVSANSHHRYHPRRWPVLLLTLLACFMDLLDATVVMVALPAIQQSLGSSPAMLQWTSAGYMLTFAVLLITGGRIGDRFGRKRTFVAGVAGFTIASVLCGLAQTPAMLVGSRVLQGATAALMIPQVLSFIQLEFSPMERPKALALYGMTLALGGVSGPVLGGLLIQASLFDLSWRSIFLINVPVGLVALIGVWLLMPESRAPDPPELDPLGVLLLVSGLLALMYPLVQGRESGWPTWAYLCFAAAVPIFMIFGRYQRFRAAHRGFPLVPPRIFRHRSVVAGLLISLIFFAGTGYTFVFSLYLQEGIGYSPVRTGLTLLPFSIGIIAGSGLSTHLVPRLGRAVVTIGALIKLTGVVCMIYPIHSAGGELSPWALAPGAIITGFGMAMVSVTLVNIVLAKVPASDAGAASGLINTTLQVGTAASVAILGTVFFSRLTSTGSFEQAVETSLWVTVVLFFASFLVSFVLPPGEVQAQSPQDTETGDRATRPVHSRSRN